MAFTHIITQKITPNSGNPIEKAITLTGGSESNLSESIPDSSTDLQVTFELDVSQVKALFIMSDQNITIETNNGTTPDDTLNLVANEPVVWYTGSLLTNPIGTDITTDIFVTNSSGSTATLTIYALTDPTP